MTPDQIESVVSLLQSSNKSLKELALSVKMDPFTFFQGAALNSLDLSGQDLREMNFDKADLRFSDLTNTLYDAGSFNGSILDRHQLWLKDEFEFYAKDVFEHPIDEILVFCKFRPLNFEVVFVEALMSYREFSERAGVSENALRKARRGEIVAYETALRILRFLGEVEDRHVVPFPTPIIQSMIRQPVVAMFSGGNNTPFKVVGRERLRELISMRAEIMEVRRLMYPDTVLTKWRDTPESIESILDYYRDHKSRLEAKG